MTLAISNSPSLGAITDLISGSFDNVEGAILIAQLEQLGQTRDSLRQAVNQMRQNSRVQTVYKNKMKKLRELKDWLSKHGNTGKDENKGMTIDNLAKKLFPLPEDEPMGTKRHKLASEYGLNFSGFKFNKKEGIVEPIVMGSMIGDGKPITVGLVANQLESFKSDVDVLGNSAQEINLLMQHHMHTMQQSMTKMSNISDSRHRAMMAVLNKLG